MAQMMLPQIPAPSGAKDAAGVAAYIDKLYAVLSKWQVLLNSTKFLGSADGHLTISDDEPVSADGHDKDIWIQY